jgi:hypothetical protein
MVLTAIRLNSALMFTVTVTSEALFALLEWCLCHHGTAIRLIALVPGTKLQTIDSVYIQLPSAVHRFAELNPLESQKCLIFYPITSDVCALPIARHVCSRVG